MAAAQRADPGYRNVILERRLRAALARLTGKPVEQVVTEVAASVGMTQSALDPTDDSTMPDPSSHGYIESAGAQSM